MALDFDHDLPNRLRPVMWVVILLIIIGIIVVAIIY